MTMVFNAVLASVFIWLGLLFARGGFWRADQRLPLFPQPDPAAWPEVTVVIPARDEAETIAEVLTSHGASRYPGKLSIILVDDGSSDGTGEIAESLDLARPLRVLRAPEIEPGWTGKLWALHNGTAALPESAEFVLLTDADIAHAPDTLGKLMRQAQAGYGLVSLMARLDARGIWGGLLIPAFVFFFQKLYPFPRVNDPCAAEAGAAGGCVLLRRDALEAIGGIAAIRGALIDDCTLAAHVKAAGYATWLGLADGPDPARAEVRSLRDNRSLGSVWKMVARTAFTQLRYSPLLLAGSVLGMALVYLPGPLGLLAAIALGDGMLAAFSLLAWGLMAGAYRPTARLYAMPVWQAATLPLAAAFYMAMTLDSARRHWMGRGGAWKGRTYGQGENAAS